MSAIDFYCSVDKGKGVDGKDRVVITFDGKYLPYTEQVSFRSALLLQKKHESKPSWFFVATKWNWKSFRKKNKELKCRQLCKSFEVKVFHLN